jgi:F420-dependent oxidoreductase-like protein
MTEVSIMIEGQMGLTWPRWKAIADAVDNGGFAGLFRSDHFTGPRGPYEDALEMTISLAYLATATHRIHFGPLVAPVSFRDPIQLARQAAALDDLSGGRMILGLGAGWQEREHHNYGYDLGDMKTRMDRLEEALEVTARLLHSAEPFTFEGRFYQLRDAILLPRPARPGGPPILIGGGGPRRTMPLVARYAQIWNFIPAGPDDFRERSANLDTLLQQAGRQPGDVKRTIMTGLIFGRDQAALEQALAWHSRLAPAAAGKSVDEQLAFWRDERHMIAGTAGDVLAQIQAYAAAGVAEVMLQWFDMTDIDGLHAFAEQVLPGLSRWPSVH